MHFARSVLNGMLTAFSGRGNVEEAWVDTGQVLSERERVVQRVTRILQWGAILHALLVFGMLITIAAEMADLNLFAALLLRGVVASADTLVILGLVGLAANTSWLLLLSSGAAAQEFWMLLLALLGIIVNGVALVLWQFIPGLLAIFFMGAAVGYALRDWRAFHSNAVTVKELRGRMRGSRSFAIITIFLLLMGAFTVLLYMLQLPILSTQDTIITGDLGRSLFRAVVGIELLLIIFIVPALTASAVTGERERKTYDLLQTTLLPAPTFIVGKMESALGYILLLLLSAIPLQSIAFLFGGVGAIEIGVAFVLLVVTALALGALGMFFSALTERTMTATVRVYTVAVFLIFGLPLASVLLYKTSFLLAVSGQNVPAATATEQAYLVYGDLLLSSLNPVLSAIYTQEMVISQQKIALMTVELRNNTFIPVLAPWILTSIIYVGISAFLMLLAVRQMRRSS